MSRTAVPCRSRLTSLERCGTTERLLLRLEPATSYSDGICGEGDCVRCVHCRLTEDWSGLQDDRNRIAVRLCRCGRCHPQLMHLNCSAMSGSRPRLVFPYGNNFCVSAMRAESRTSCEQQRCVWRYVRPTIRSNMRPWSWLEQRPDRRLSKRSYTAHEAVLSRTVIRSPNDGPNITLSFKRHSWRKNMCSERLRVHPNGRTSRQGQTARSNWMYLRLARRTSVIPDDGPDVRAERESSVRECGLSITALLIGMSVGRQTDPGVWWVKCPGFAPYVQSNRVPVNRTSKRPLLSTSAQRCVDRGLRTSKRLNVRHGAWESVTLSSSRCLRRDTRSGSGPTPGRSSNICDVRKPVDYSPS